MSEMIAEALEKAELLPEKVYVEVLLKGEEDGLVISTYVKPEECVVVDGGDQEYVLGEYKLVGTVKVKSKREITVEEKRGGER